MTGGHLSAKAVHQDTVDDVKASLTPAELAEFNDDDVRRFIRASNLDKTVAVKRLRATYLWREKERPKEMFCEACRNEPRAHYVHVVGFDNVERPVIYSCLQLAKNKVLEDNRKHMISTFERSIKMMPKGVEQWVWVSDFHGFGVADLNPGMAKVFLDVSATHYPERLGVFLVVDPPRIFNTLYNLIYPLVDPVTKDKIRFVQYDLDKKTQGKLMREELLKLFDEELTDWLMNEMKENRNKAVNKHKVYSYEDLAELARNSSTAAASDGGGHDSRGTKRLIHKVASEPQLLTPQVPLLHINAGQL